MKQIPRYFSFTPGAFDLFMSSFCPSNNSAARLYALMVSCSVWGDRLTGPASSWLKDWAAARFPGAGLNMFLVVQVSRADAVEALGVCEKTVRSAFGKLESLGLVVRVHEAKRYEPPLYAICPCPAPAVGAGSQGGKETGESYHPGNCQGGKKTGFRVVTPDAVTWGRGPGINNNNNNTVTCRVNPYETDPNGSRKQIGPEAAARDGPP